MKTIKAIGYIVLGAISLLCIIATACLVQEKLLHFIPGVVIGVLSGILLVECIKWTSKLFN